MARSRNIKPALFKNELLGEIDPIVTLLFQGLWCLADRDGRLEDRPKRIKAEIFPYRELPDFNGYLTVLEQLGFIDRYVVQERAVIQVVNFEKHQSPHKTEKASDLPEKPIKTDSCNVTVKAPLKTESVTVKESLIPDSLIPDSLSTFVEVETSIDICEDEKTQSKTPLCPHEKIIEIYHEKLPDCTRVTLSLWKDSARAKNLTARWRQDARHQDIRFWEWFFSGIPSLKNGWYVGNGWKADLGWILEKRNFINLLEQINSQQAAA